MKTPHEGQSRNERGDSKIDTSGEFARIVRILPCSLPHLWTFASHYSRAVRFFATSECSLGFFRRSGPEGVSGRLQPNVRLVKKMLTEQYCGHPNTIPNMCYTVQNGPCKRVSFL